MSLCSTATEPNQKPVHIEVHQMSAVGMTVNQHLSGLKVVGKGGILGLTFFCNSSTAINMNPVDKHNATVVPTANKKVFTQGTAMTQDITKQKGPFS